MRAPNFNVVIIKYGTFKNVVLCICYIFIDAYERLYESMSKFVKILVFSIFYENHLPDRDLNFFI